MNDRKSSFRQRDSSTILPSHSRARAHPGRKTEVRMRGRAGGSLFALNPLSLGGVYSFRKRKKDIYIFLIKLLVGCAEVDHSYNEPG